MAYPMRELAVRAAAVSRLDLADMTPLGRSMVRELDAQNVAFNAMVASLRWFATYMPKSLVHRLLSRGDSDGMPLVERNVTVMFTDIVGFTVEAERLTASETAAFLNTHFALLTACIEAEGGTVDKFIGDSVMTFWNAPDQDDHHTDHAFLAALAILTAIRKENATRLIRGERSIRLRIGIHSGPAVVGNIGSAQRLNYTVVGDTVNVAQRCEVLGKEFDREDAEVTILISSHTRAALRQAILMSYAGSVPMRRRTGSIEAYLVN
jgi:adenylate cyclase